MIWTFIIRDGTEVRLVLPHRPPLEHPGKGAVTIWKTSGTEEEAAQLQATLEGQGCSIERYGEGETDEQHSIRMARLGRGDGDAAL